MTNLLTDEFRTEAQIKAQAEINKLITSSGWGLTGTVADTAFEVIEDFAETHQNCSTSHIRRLFFNDVTAMIESVDIVFDEISA